MTQETGQGQEAQGNEDGQANRPATWEAWLTAQPEDQRGMIGTLYNQSVAGLKSALDKERGDRKDYEKQLRDLAKTAEAGSKAQTDLVALADQLDAANRRADFYRDAAKPDLGLVGVAAAWTLMNAEPDRYFDRKGNPNFDLLKQEHPYLFGARQPIPKGNQGNGLTNSQVGASSMNSLIRKAAGRE